MRTKVKTNAETKPVHAGGPRAGAVDRETKNAQPANGCSISSASKTVDATTVQGRLLGANKADWDALPEARRTNLRDLLIVGWRISRDRKGVLPAAVKELQRGNRTMRRGTISIAEQAALQEEANNFAKAARLADQLREVLTNCANWRYPRLEIVPWEWTFYSGLEAKDLSMDPEQLEALSGNLDKAAKHFAELARTEGKRPRKRPVEEEDRKLLDWATRMGYSIPMLARMITDVPFADRQLTPQEQRRAEEERLQSLPSERTKWARHFRAVERSMKRRRR